MYLMSKYVAFVCLTLLKVKSLISADAVLLPRVKLAEQAEVMRPADGSRGTQEGVQVSEAMSQMIGLLHDIFSPPTQQENTSRTSEQRRNNI